MSHRIAPVCIAAMIAVTAPVHAQQTPPETPHADKKVCRQIAVRGSMFTKRICHSAAEWAEIDNRNDRDGRDTLDRTRHARSVPLG